MWIVVVPEFAKILFNAALFSEGLAEVDNDHWRTVVGTCGASDVLEDVLSLMPTIVKTATSMNTSLNRKSGTSSAFISVRTLVNRYELPWSLHLSFCILSDDAEASRSSYTPSPLDNGKKFR
jgi:hypothetical protein